MLQLEFHQTAGKKMSPAFFKKWVTRIERRARGAHGTISLAIVGEQAMKKYNTIYRGKARATNVLSFAERDGMNKNFVQQDKAYLGEVILCYSVIAHEAKQRALPFSAHCGHLFVHGVLHLLGYDHITEHDARKMEALEDKILAD